MGTKQFLFPLFWKFTLAIILVVATFGTLNYYFINRALIKLSNTEIERHGRSIANSISERSIDPILFEDLSNLDQIVSDNIRVDSGIAYLLIFDKNSELIAHSFETNIPTEIIKHNIVARSNKESISRIIDKDKNIIRNIIVPIFDGNLGRVCIGIYEENFTNSINSINNFFLTMVVLFLFFGIMGALIFSYIITSPIKKISKISENLNLNSIKKSTKEVFKNNPNFSFKRKKNVLEITDEIDVLISKFNEMVFRLQNTYEELQYSQASLFQSEKMASLGTLSAGIAHEINNPIAGIQNCIRRLKKSPDDIRQNILYLEMMGKSVNKIENVVKGLLNISRKNDFIFEDINLSDVIENVLFLISYQLEDSRIAIRKEYQSNRIFSVKASRNHLEQVILNVVLNSIEAIDEKRLVSPFHFGEIKFTIEESENFVIVEISDNGIGISIDELDFVFDPFFTKKKIRQGTGLGLTVSYSIIEQHNGKISTLISSNGGFTVKISLPKK